LFTRELYYQENKYQVPYVVVGRGGHWELHHIQKHSNGDQNDTPFKLPDMENVVLEKYKNASIRSITAPKGYTYSDVGKKVYTGYEDYNIIPAGTTYALAGYYRGHNPDWTVFVGGGKRVYQGKFLHVSNTSHL
jgi:hypothetical protein